LSVSGIIVPLNGIPSRIAQQAVILLRNDSSAIIWTRATVVFALVMGLTSLVSVRAMRRWFDRRITTPLRDMTSAAQRSLDESGDVPALEPGEWCETTQIAEQLHVLRQRIIKGEAYARRLERESQHKIRDRELGFDRQLRRARDLATIDPLTRVRNRSFFAEKLEPLFEHHRANGDDLSAVMIDIDNFKRYNDTKGHQVGDTVLRFVGALLLGGIRPTDHAIRYGGDEFLLLLPETSAEETQLIADRLVKLFGQYALRLGKKHKLSISAGVASLKTDNPKDGHELVACADAALYAAKRKGKNTVIAHRRV